MIMMIIGHNFHPCLDDCGSLTNIGKIFPGGDLGVGYTVVGHQGGPGVQSNL